MRRIRKRPRHGDAGVVFGVRGRRLDAARKFGGDGACDHRGGCRRERVACVPTFGPDFYCRLSHPPCVGRKLNTRFRAVNNPTQIFFTRVIFQSLASVSRDDPDRADRTSRRVVDRCHESIAEFRIRILSAAATRLSIRTHADSAAEEVQHAVAGDASSRHFAASDDGENFFARKLRIPASQHPKCANCAKIEHASSVSQRSRRQSDAGSTHASPSSTRQPLHRHRPCAALHGTFPGTGNPSSTTLFASAENDTGRLRGRLSLIVRCPDPDQCSSSSIIAA